MGETLEVAPPAPSTPVRVAQPVKLPITDALPLALMQAVAQLLLVGEKERLTVALFEGDPVPLTVGEEEVLPL